VELAVWITLDQGSSCLSSEAHERWLAAVRDPWDEAGITAGNPGRL